MLNNHIESIFWRRIYFMDFKQIEAFVNVAKYKSFSKAAEAIYLSQPTISTHINSLESELKAVLFDRSGKEVQLTPAGKIFYMHAADMINTRNRAIQSIAEFYDRIEGELKISCSTTPCKCILPDIVREFLKKYPSVRFKISEAGSGDVISSLLRYDAELGIVGKMMPDERLEYHDFADDNLVAITPVNGKFSDIKESSLYFKELQQEHFILRQENSATRQIFESALSSSGYDKVKLNVISEVNSMDAALQFVKSGLGVTVMSENAAREYIDSKLVRVFHIKDLPLVRKIYLVRCSKRTLSPAAKMFEKFIFESYKKPCLML